MIDDIFVLYKNSGKYFKDYNSAFFNGMNAPVQNKKVTYVFTPTMCEYKRVSELENACKRYFKNTTGFEFYDIFTGKGNTQLKLIGDV